MYLILGSPWPPAASSAPNASSRAMACSTVSEGHAIAKFAEVPDEWTMAYFAPRPRLIAAINSCGDLGTESSCVFGNATRLSRATRMSTSPWSFFPGPSIGVATQTKSSRSTALHAETTQRYTAEGIRGV
jgi:hypothetical protein